MMIDYIITVGNIIEIGSIIAGGFAVLWTLKADVNSLKAGTELLKIDLASMQSEIRKLSEILINLSDIRGEIRVLDTRITMAEQDIREIKHGDGFVRSINREYP